MQQDKPHPDNPAPQDDDAPKGPPAQPNDGAGPGGDPPPIKH